MADSAGSNLRKNILTVTLWVGLLGVALRVVLDVVPRGNTQERVLLIALVVAVWGLLYVAVRSLVRGTFSWLVAVAVVAMLGTGTGYGVVLVHDRDGEIDRLTDQLFVPAPPEPSGTITVPITDGSVSYEVIANGTARDIPATSTAWLVSEVVGPAGHQYWETFKGVFQNRLWPAPNPVKLLPGGRWESGIALGSRADPGTIGLHYRISLVVADANIEGRFQQYAETAQETQQFVGIRRPDDLTVLDAIDVVLDPGSPS